MATVRGLSLVVLLLLTEIGLSGCSKQIGMWTSSHNGHYELHAHSMQGTLQIASFQVSSSKVVEISYQGTVARGDEDIVVQNAKGQTVQHADIDSPSQGTIKFTPAAPGRFTIQLVSTNATNCSLILDLSKVDANVSGFPGL